MSSSAPRHPSLPSRDTAASATGVASMQQRAYAILKEMIRDGRVQPGEKLLEVQVARAFGVSRSPARHALHALAADRLVRPSAGRGYIVSGRAAGVEPGKLATLSESRLAPVPRWERVYAEVEQDLCSAIVCHAVRITEERLAEHFGVSRTVARDVLSRMHSVGLLGKDRFGRWMAERITPTRVRDLYEMRWLLEPQALAQSAPHVPRARLERASEDLQRLLATTSKADSALLARLENDLHVDLLACCPNQVMLRTLGHTHLLLVSNQYVFDLYLGIDRAVMKTAMREHLAVVELLLAGAWESAANILSDHLKASCGVWLERFELVSALAMPPPPPYLSPTEGPEAN